MNQINAANFVSNKWNIAVIAKLLGVVVDEPFKIQFFKHKQPYKDAWYKLTDQGLMYAYSKDGRYAKSDALEGLLIGKHQVVK